MENKQSRKKEFIDNPRKALWKLAIPMMLLYEVSIYACRIVERKREEAWAADADDDGFEDTDFNEA